MDKTQSPEIELRRLKCYATLFSRKVFMNILLYNDFSEINSCISYHDGKLISNTDYSQYLKRAYRALRGGFQCEYVFKNELLNHYLIKHKKIKDTLAINEFKVGEAIADIAFFNGESIAFEIKTPYDSPKRLNHQLEEYNKLFQKRILVLSSSDCDRYLNDLDSSTGIVLLHFNKRSCEIEIIREPKTNSHVDALTIMHSLREKEYQAIIKDYFGEVPEYNSFTMFTECSKLIAEIPEATLHESLLTQMKKRKSTAKCLNKYPAEFRQVILALNLSETKSQALINKLKTPISL